jgi:hypothetical protein
MNNLYYSELLLERDYDLLLCNVTSLIDERPGVGKNTEWI